MRTRKTRHVLAAAVLGIAAVAAMTGCRVEQGAAVFVGDTRITSDQVDEVTDSLPTKAQAPMGGFRSMAIDALAVVELGKQVAADNGKSPKTSDGALQEKYWAEKGLPKSNAFVKLMAKAEGYRSMLAKGSDPVKPSSAEVADVTKRLEANSGQKLAGADKQALSAELKSDKGQEIFGNRKQLADYVKKYDVTANPRYGDTYIVIARGQQFEPLVTVQLES